MKRRILGIETEFGVTCAADGQRTLTPDEVARYMFRSVVAWGRSSNVFLSNGARLYLDVGSHPEYATAECDSVRQLVLQDKAGERIVHSLVIEASQRLREEGFRGTIYVFKNNVDSAGNSYGCHENLLVDRDSDFQSVTDRLIPFLVTRQLIAGAGKVINTTRGARYMLSQRADHMWEGVSSATTRSRPIINTRDEPHADAERYRRLHVIVGDANLSETTTMVKVGSLDLVLRMLEENAPMRDLSLENPIRAIRDAATDITGRKELRLASGRTISALDIQAEYLQRAIAFVEREGASDPSTPEVLSLWRRTLEAIEIDDLTDIETEIDWVIKMRLIDSYADRHNISLDHPRIAQLDLAYHDIDPQRGLFNVLQRNGLAARFSSDQEIDRATIVPPQTTRARLRGNFVAAAQAANRDFTVDWVHLKLNDQAQRTLLCKDPFQAVDRRVDTLIASMKLS